MKCLVVMPVGPGFDPENITDSVEAFRHYMSDSTLLIVNDSGGLLDLPPYKNVHSVLPHFVGPHCWGRVFANQVAAVEQFEGDWDVLLRIDDDALIIGPDPHHDALAYFRANPGTGMIGAFRRRGDGTDKSKDMEALGRTQLRQIASKSGLKSPRMSFALARLLRAKCKIHDLGDNVTGGSFFLSKVAFRAILAHGTYHLFARSFISEDMLFSTHVAAGGYRLGDFSDPTDPMAVNWLKLPMPPEELVRHGKKVVHSIKDRDDPDYERRNRAFFKERRAA